AQRSLMGMQLLVIAGPDKGRSFPLNAGESILIGRSQAIPNRLTDPHVSRVHCEVQVEGDRITLTDSNSVAGTFVNGKKIAQQQLRPGDVIEVGGTQLRCHPAGLAAPTPADQSPLAPVTPLQARPAAPAADQLSALTGQTLSHYEVGPVLAKGQSGV